MVDISSLSKFEDIKITGFDEEASGPSDEGSLQNLVLRLSATPPAGWVTMFHNGWQQNINPYKRNAKVVGNAVHVTCHPGELQDQINGMKEIVSRANVAHHEFLAQAKAAKEINDANKAKAKKDLQDLKGKLTF